MSIYYISFFPINFFPDFNKVTKKNNKINKNCNDKYFKRIEEKLRNEKDAIIIFKGRWVV